MLRSELDGVAGIVAAVVARHDVEAVREQVDELPFALVSPLPAQDGQDLHALLSSCSNRSPAEKQRRLTESSGPVSLESAPDEDHTALRRRPDARRSRGGGGAPRHRDAVSRGPPCDRGVAPRGRPRGALGGDGLRRDDGLRQVRRRADPAGRDRGAPAQPDSKPRRGRRSRAAGSRRAGDDGAARQRAGARELRHSRLDRRDARRDARGRRPADRSGAGVGRGVGRSRSARASRARPDGRGPRPGPGPGAGRGGGAAARADSAGGSGSEGRARAHQRSADVGGGRRPRAEPGDRPGEDGGPRRSGVPGRLPRIRRRVRQSHRRGATASRSAEERGQPARSPARKRDPGIASRLRPGAGQLRASLHAPGPRRGARRVRSRSRGARARDEQLDGQPSGVRGAGRHRFGGKLSRSPRRIRPGLRGDRGHGSGLDLGAPHREARQPGAFGPSRRSWCGRGA